MKTAQEYYNSGLAKEDSQQFESAIEDYNEAIKLDPENADYFNQRGITKDKLKDYKGAIEDFDKAIELNPKVGKIYGNRVSAKND
jgi:tetratricopeptide (TPR) repeat protein